jgi:FkbM family methyltransferase
MAIAEIKESISINWSDIIEKIGTLEMNYPSMPKSKVALFGAGVNGQEALAYFQKKGIGIQCFIDNNQEKHGRSVEGIPIVSIEHPLSESASLIVITLKNSVKVIQNQLKRRNLKSISFNELYVKENIDRYERVRNKILSDERSRLSLDGILMAMLTNSMGYCAEIMEDNQYFCLSHFQNIGEEYFVDAGAYVGDTIEKFIWANTGLFKHIFLFEPGSRQFEALKHRMDRLITEWALDPGRITLINAGLSDKSSRANFSTPSYKLAAMAITDDKITPIQTTASNVPLWELDAFMEANPSPITFIKSDVEGMELELLRGAKTTIRKHKPKLSLSVYHKPDDLFQIIDFVRDIVPEYLISLRHHSSNLSETVLYCWVETE